MDCWAHLRVLKYTNQLSTLIHVTVFFTGSIAAIGAKNKSSRNLKALHNVVEFTTDHYPQRSIEVTDASGSEMARFLH